MSNLGIGGRSGLYSRPGDSIGGLDEIILPGASPASKGEGSSGLSDWPQNSPAD